MENSSFVTQVIQCSSSRFIVPICLWSIQNGKFVINHTLDSNFSTKLTHDSETLRRSCIPYCSKQLCNLIVMKQIHIPKINSLNHYPHVTKLVFLLFRYENTAACLLLSLANIEVQQQAYRSISGKFSIVSPDSEELNRILVLTLARAINAVCMLDGIYAKNNHHFRQIF